MKYIKYQILIENDYGTPENPDIRQEIRKAKIPYSKANEEVARAEAYNGEYQIIDIPDTRPLHEIKSECIAQSKTDLQRYLETHPVLWTDGKYYSITSEKQQWLTSKLFSAMMAKQSGQPYTLTWNDTEEVCTEWDLDELWKLARVIEERVTKLVTYQQTKEVEIRKCETKEELELIEINYDNV